MENVLFQAGIFVSLTQAIYDLQVNLINNTQFADADLSVDEVQHNKTITKIE